MKKGMQGKIMAKTKFIKDKKGKFAGSIGQGKDNIPTSVIPVLPKTTPTTNAPDVFTQLGEWAEKFDTIAIKQIEGRHNPYAPINAGGYALDQITTEDENFSVHARAEYDRPCSGCKTEDPNLRYRSGVSAYCYDCASYAALKQRSNLKGWDDLPTREEFITWRRGQKRVCYYCGIDEKDVYKQGVKNTRAGGNLPESLGNDRWDSNRPYVIDNMVLSCFACNQLKSNTMTGDEFIKYFGEACTRRSKDMVEAYNSAHQYCCPAA